ncbi:hypothetical protein EV401DRAFT_31807 [Pisolithus croceorrhizus]|nr:hypothetical protein EV401DRAFT_31807 [Pisolithus croceorrhizus]
MVSSGFMPRVNGKAPENQNQLLRSCWMERPNGIVTVEAAIKFFMNLFGVNNFKFFIGEISFFSELPSIMATETCGKTCIGTGGVSMDSEMSSADCGSGSGLPTWHVMEDRQVTETVEEERIEALVECVKHIGSSFARDVTHIYVPGTKLWEEAIKWRLRPFAAEFLRLVATVYKKWKPRQFSYKQDTKFDKQKFLTDIQEIKKLQEILTEIDDDNNGNRGNDDERRALMEDITGRILLTCWQGISFEVVRIVEKVVNRLFDKEDMGWKTVAKDRIHNIGWVLSQAASSVLDDGLDPLQRMMHDAADGVAKHQLLLAQLDGWASPNYGSAEKMRKGTDCR